MPSARFPLTTSAGGVRESNRNPAAVAPTHWIPSNTAAWDHSYVSTHAASESVMRTFRTRAELC